MKKVLNVSLLIFGFCACASANINHSPAGLPNPESTIISAIPLPDPGSPNVPVDYAIPLPDPGSPNVPVNAIPLPDPGSPGVPIGN